MAKTWMANTMPSLPAPPPKDPEVDLGGFCFTGGGIAHPVNTGLAEEVALSLFVPDDETANGILKQLGVVNNS